MKTLITGAAGFIGSSVVREVLADGQEVRLLLRERNPKNVAELDVEAIKGDLLDPDSLDRALAGCNKLYHMASIYAHWHPKGAGHIRRVNLEGTQNILEAAARRDLEKIVHTSSISAVGFFPHRPSTEADYPTEDQVQRQPYRESKWKSEIVAKEWSEKLPLVIVNPASPIGVRDWVPTPTGRMVLDFLNGKMFAYVDVGINLMDVEDMARGFVAAEKKGRIGERYILGNKNMFLKDFFALLADITSLPAPLFKVPKAIVRAVAEIAEPIADLIQKEPLVAIEQSLHLSYNEFVDCTKAVTELNLPQNDIRIAALKAVQYYLETGAVKPERAKMINLKD